MNEPSTHSHDQRPEQGALPDVRFSPLAEMSAPQGVSPQPVAAEEAERLTSCPQPLAEMQAPASITRQEIEAAPIVVSASAPIEDIVRGARRVAVNLRLPDMEGNTVLSRFESFLERIAGGEGHEARELFTRLLLLSPEMQAITWRNQHETSVYSAGPLHRMQIAFAGAVYFFTELIENDMALGAALLRAYDQKGVHGRELLGKLGAFYEKLAKGQESALGQLVRRELKNTASVGETAFLAGMTSPYAGAEASIPKNFFQRAWRWIDSIFNKFPRHLKDLAIAHPMNLATADFLDTLSDAAYREPKGRRREQKPGGENEPGNGSMLAVLVNKTLQQEESPAEQRPILLEIWKTLRKMKACSEADVELLLEKLPPAADVVLQEGLGIAIRAINRMADRDRITNAWWSDDQRAPLSLSIVVEALRKVKPEEIGDVARFEALLPRVSDFIDQFYSGGGRDGTFRAELKQICTKWHTKTLAKYRGEE